MPFDTLIKEKSLHINTVRPFLAAASTRVARAVLWVELIALAAVAPVLIQAAAGTADQMTCNPQQIADCLSWYYMLQGAGYAVSISLIVVLGLLIGCLLLETPGRPSKAGWLEPVTSVLTVLAPLLAAACVIVLPLLAQTL